MDTPTAKTKYELLMERRNFLGALVALALPLPIGIERKGITYVVFENIPLKEFGVISMDLPRFTINFTQPGNLMWVQTALRVEEK